MKGLLKRSCLESEKSLSSLVPAVGAAILWGTGALYANHDRGLSASVVSAITQGIATFCFTFYISVSVTYLFDRCDRSVWKAIFPVVGTVGAQGTLLVLVHYFAKTPAIL